MKIPHKNKLGFSPGELCFVQQHAILWGNDSNHGAIALADLKSGTLIMVISPDSAVSNGFIYGLTSAGAGEIDIYVLQSVEKQNEG